MSYKKTINPPSPAVANQPSPPRPARAATLVYVIKLHSQDLMLKVEKADGSPPFLYPTEQYLVQHPEFLSKSLGINNFFDKVDPAGNHTTYLRAPSSTSRFNAASSNERSYPIFISLLTTDQAERATPGDRQRFAENFVRFLNHPDNVRLYKFPVNFAYGGDLTPTEDTNCPYVSEYATYSDTMSVLRRVLSSVIHTHDEHGLPSIGDCLQHEEGMSDYFHPDHIENARNFFAGYRNHIPAGGQNQNGAPNAGNEPEPFHDWGEFKL